MTAPRNWHNNAVPSSARQPVHGPTGRVKSGFGTCDTCGSACHEYATRCKECYGLSAYRVQRMGDSQTLFTLQEEDR